LAVIAAIDGKREVFTCEKAREVVRSARGFKLQEGRKALRILHIRCPWRVA
jgi:hypothetical protein